MPSLPRAAACAVIVTLVAAGSAAASGKRYASDCVKAVQHPASLTLSCGDANSGLAKLAWTGWGSAVAKATGRFTYNTCTPDCAAGKEVSVPVKVTVSGHRSCSGKDTYPKVALTFTGKVPAGYKRDSATTLPCPAT